MELTSDSAIVEWEPPPLQHHNGIIVGYVVNVTLVDTGEVFQLDANAVELTLDSLQSHTSYTIVIAAQTVVGIGPFSTALLFRTEEDGKNY